MPVPDGIETIVETAPFAEGSEPETNQPNLHIVPWIPSEIPVQLTLSAPADLQTVPPVDRAVAAPAEAKNRSEYQTGRVATRGVLDIEDTFGIYLNEMGGLPVLSDEAHQKVLIQKVQIGQQAQKRLESAGVLPGRNGQMTLDEVLVEQGNEARNIFVAGNLRLVVSVTKRVTRTMNLRNYPTINFPELVQEGNIGLMRAVEKFDPDKGFKFSTYATWWIRQSVQRTIHQKERLIAVPTNTAPVLTRLAQLMQLETPYPKIQEELNVTAEELDELLMIPSNLVSLDKPVETDYSDVSLHEAIGSPDPRLHTVEMERLNDDLWAKVEEIIDDPQQAAIVLAHCGAVTGEPMKFVDIDKMLGLKPRRSEYLYKKAIATLQASDIGGTYHLSDYAPL